MKIISDPYEILGVDRDATSDEINAAFKAKAKQAHPDTGGSADDFTRVKQASLVLLDPEKRRRFDEDGVVDENKPDIITSSAMERIANFFVNSINASLNFSSYNQLEQLDLVHGANAFFNQHIANSNNQILQVGRQIKQFEKALGRLKTARKNDVIRTMLNHHIVELKNSLKIQEREILIHNTAKEILKDYTFDNVQPARYSGLFAGN